MKSFLYFIISIIISVSLTSAVQQTSGSNKSVTLQAVDNHIGQGSLQQSADIISSRLKSIGLSSIEIKIISDKGQLKITLPDKTDITEIEGFLTSKGELAFYETYTHAEITDLLKSDNQLFKLLNHDQDQESSDPRVGCTSNENRQKTDDFLRSASPLKNCKLFWGFESEKSGFCLFALKTNNEGNPLLIRSDVESVKIVAGKDNQDNKIQIKLKPAAIGIFATATKNNLNKAIAIIIDDRVYSWPVVRSVIEGGEIEVTGNFSAKEVSYFPALFNSAQLPAGFRLLK
jgi:preprotein translocase subunit SecD